MGCMSKCWLICAPRQILMQEDHKGQLDHIAQWVTDEFKDKKGKVGCLLAFMLAQQLLLQVLSLLLLTAGSPLTP